MPRTRRNWLVPFVVAACGLLLLGAVLLLVPRRPARLTLGEPGSFRFMPDPHYFLNLEEVSRRETVGGSSLALGLVATNTAAGDMRIDLRPLRVAVVTADGRTLDGVAPVWSGAATKLEARTSASASLELPLPAGVEPVAVLVWQESVVTRWVPAVRGSIFCPTLELELDSGVAVPVP